MEQPQINGGSLSQYLYYHKECIKRSIQTSLTPSDVGFNSKDIFDPYIIKAYSIESNMSSDYVKSLIDQAIREKT